MANERMRKRPKPKAERVEAPEVVYTQPETMERKKMIVRLLTVAAVVLALFVGFSIFFRVDKITVSGNQKYNTWTVVEVSGIEEGDSLLTFGKARACGRIAEALPYVKVVRVGIKLPGTVNIYIQEVDVVYSIQAQDGNWWRMTSEGRLVEKTSATEAAKHTVIKGVRLVAPKAGEEAVALEPEEQQTDAEGEEIPVTVTNAERLQTALEILVQLEHQQIIGTVASVDVTDMGAIELWYSDKYQVLLGDPGGIDMKIAKLKGTLDKLGSHQSGILDISSPDENGSVHHRPFGQG